MLQRTTPWSERCLTFAAAYFRFAPFPWLPACPGSGPARR